MNAADRRRLTLWLGVLAIVLAALLVALWFGLGRDVHWRAGGAAERVPRAAAGLAAPPTQPLPHFAAVWEHPLFSPTRTPEPVAGGAGGASGDLALTGVILLPGLKMAIVHDRTRDRDYRLIAGQASRDGPLLVALHPRSAVIEVSGAREELHLVPAASPDASAAAGAVGEPPASNVSDSVTPRPQGGRAAAARVQRLRTRTGATPNASAPRPRGDNG